jgi:hypothetical protein
MRRDPLVGIGAQRREAEHPRGAVGSAQEAGEGGEVARVLVEPGVVGDDEQDGAPRHPAHEIEHESLAALHEPRDGSGRPPAHRLGEPPELHVPGQWIEQGEVEGHRHGSVPRRGVAALPRRACSSRRPSGPATNHAG